MPNLKPVTIDRRTARRVVQAMEWLLLLTQFSEFARNIVGMDTERAKAVKNDIDFIKG